MCQSMMSFVNVVDSSGLCHSHTYEKVNVHKMMMMLFINVDSSGLCHSYTYEKVNVHKKKKKMMMTSLF